MSCICEYCGKEFTEDYRSNKNLSTARFCSKSCKAKFNGKKNKGVIGHKNYFTDSFINYDINKACPYCNKEFIKYFSYKNHVGQCVNNPKRILTKVPSLSEWELRKEKIITCGVDLTTFGWVGKVTEATGFSKRIIENTIKRFPNEFEGKIFRRKSCSKK